METSQWADIEDDEENSSPQINKNNDKQEDMTVEYKLQPTGETMNNRENRHPHKQFNKKPLLNPDEMIEQIKNDKPFKIYIHCFQMNGSSTNFRETFQDQVRYVNLIDSKKADRDNSIDLKFDDQEEAIKFIQLSQTTPLNGRNFRIKFGKFLRTNDNFKNNDFKGEHNQRTGHYEKRDHKYGGERNFNRNSNDEHQHGHGKYGNREKGEFVNREKGEFRNREKGEYKNHEKGEFGNREKGEYRNREKGEFKNYEKGEFGNREKGEFGNREKGEFGNREKGEYKPHYKRENNNEMRNDDRYQDRKQEQNQQGTTEAFKPRGFVNTKKETPATQVSESEKIQCVDTNAKIIEKQKRDEQEKLQNVEEQKKESTMKQTEQKNEANQQVNQNGKNQKENESISNKTNTQNKNQSTKPAIQEKQSEKAPQKKNDEERAQKPKEQTEKKQEVLQDNNEDEQKKQQPVENKVVEDEWNVVGVNLIPKNKLREYILFNYSQKGKTTDKKPKYDDRRGKGGNNNDGKRFNNNNKKNYERRTDEKK